jgi:GYF domain 2
MISVPCLRCRALASADEGAAAVTCPSCSLALPPPGAGAWYMTRDGSQQFGPYTLAQIRSFVGTGNLIPADRLWYHGAPEWVTAAELPGLAGDAAPAAPVHTAPMNAAYGAAGPAGMGHTLAPYAAQAQAAPRRAGFHIHRALGWDLRAIEVEPAERDLLVARGVDEEDARRYLCWRKSVLRVVAIPTLVSALLALIGLVTTDLSAFSGVGLLLEFARVAALFALPVTAWLAAKAWDRHRRSRNILLRGWLVAFLTPLLLALIPYSWRVDMSGADATVQGQVTALVSLLGAVSVYVTLMPAVLSLIPGVLRACLRVKALLPESILPGWFLVASTPLYVLLFLVIFSTVNQVAGHALLILAVVALLGAPLLYLVNAKTFTRPLHDAAEVAKIGQVQKNVYIVTAVGLVLLFLWAVTAELFNHSLIGLDARTSFVRPWDPDLFQFPLEYVVRSLFTTVLVADLFMLMNLSVWHHTKAFVGTERAATYDRLMSEIEEAGSQA